MLTVWCVCVGQKYDDDYVYRLNAMVERNIKQRFLFRCLSDRAIPDVDCYLTPVNWPGWWQKLYLFKIATTGRHLYFDLDVVITGNVDDLVSDQLSLPKNWAQSGHGGCQSSVMSWGQDYSHIANHFYPSLLSAPGNGNFGYYGPGRLWGDQEFITAIVGPPGGEFVKPMQGIYSYKYHCKTGLPVGARVVCFHGNPKPADVSAPWVIYARSGSREPEQQLAT